MKRKSDLTPSKGKNNSVQPTSKEMKNALDKKLKQVKKMGNDAYKRLEKAEKTEKAGTGTPISKLSGASKENAIEAAAGKGGPKSKGGEGMTGGRRAIYEAAYAQGYVDRDKDQKTLDKLINNEKVESTKKIEEQKKKRK